MTEKFKYTEDITINQNQFDILKQFEDLDIIYQFKSLMEVLRQVKNANNYKYYNETAYQFYNFHYNIYNDYTNEEVELIKNINHVTSCICFNKSKINYNPEFEPTLSNYYVEKVYSSDVEGLDFGDIYFSNAIFLQNKFEGEKLIKLSKINMSCFHNLSFDDIYNLITKFLYIRKKEEAQKVLNITLNIFDVLHYYKLLVNFKNSLLEHETTHILNIINAPYKNNWEQKIPCFFITGDITISFTDFINQEFLNDNLLLEKYVETLNNLDISCFKNLTLRIIIDAIDLYLLNEVK